MRVVRCADGGVRAVATGRTIMTQRCPAPRLLFRCEAPPRPAPRRALALVSAMAMAMSLVEDPRYRP